MIKLEEANISSEPDLLYMQEVFNQTNALLSCTQVEKPHALQELRKRQRKACHISALPTMSAYYLNHKA